jgi:hypothetical protein
MKLLTAILLFTALPASSAEIFTFNLLPADGAITGGPGDTIGWGYSIENQSTSLWLVTTGLAPGSFQFGTPDVVFDFPILAPGSTVTMPFDAATSTGLMALTWDASAPPGTVEVGSFLLDAEWWTGDPFAGGVFAFSASPASESYQATVTAAVAPEPGSVGLGGLGLFIAGGLARRRLASGTSAGAVVDSFAPRPIDWTREER